jgi:hypothetical protein
VATDNAVKVDPLLMVFVSASPPMNPIRVSLLRYIVFFPVLPGVLGHSGARGHRSQGEKLLFWGDQNGGARTGTAPSGEAEASKTAGRGNWPEAVPKTEGQIRKMIVPQDSLMDLIKA